MNKTSPDVELAEEISQFYADPLGFVLFAYPWGEKGELEQYDGPDQWQRELLTEIGEEVKARGFDGVLPVNPIREAIASGHGIGKSTMAGWLANWIVSTRPNSKGTVTANTFTQLTTKTWAAIQHWMRLCITSHWFITTGERIYRAGAKESWYIQAQTCREENSEAFAGQHAADSTSWYLFDEASAVPDKIWEVAEGGLTDGEPMIFAFGNPTRNSGRFHKACFGSDRHRWKHRSIDSRDVRMTNKAQIAQWEQDYGEDSDFFRVRVKGVPPNASELQFVPLDLVHQAQRREAYPLADDPLVVGVDVSGGGAAWNVIRFRRGVDSRSIPPIRIPGEKGRDREVVIAKLAEILSERDPAKQVAMMFVDSAFGAPIVERLHMLGHKNVVEVNFGGDSPDAHQANLRAYMYYQMREWLKRGCIDPRDEKLEIDLTGPGYHLNKRNQLVIESKQDMAKRNVPSPDDGDALVLTFAQPVAPRKPKPKETYSFAGSGGWMA